MVVVSNVFVEPPRFAEANRQRFKRLKVSPARIADVTRSRGVVLRGPVAPLVLSADDAYALVDLIVDALECDSE
ncbi:hypothetical protein [Brevibacterium litoralis]|uniref:hypothetical protein n=1 Tax=Brevibacterium litoralis TaxID=3138935 RepID=UPI0032EF4A65